MQYRLIQTKQGLFPINEIRKGTYVLCGTEWIKSPKPIIGKCIKCTFSTLPATIFEESLVHDSVSLCEDIIYNKEEPLYELSARGFINEDAAVQRLNHVRDFNDFTYLLPRFIRLFKAPATMQMNNETHIVIRRTKFKELEHFSERNLEYYLEGYVRGYIFPKEKEFQTNRLNETDRLVLRLLNIDIFKGKSRYNIQNRLNLVSHIRDEYNKSKISYDMIAALFRTKRVCSTKFISILNKEPCEDWILPGIKPNINTLILD